MNKNLVFWALVSFLFVFISCGDAPEIVDDATKQEAQLTSNDGSLKIKIPTDQWLKLQRKKERALESGVLVNTSADYAMGKLTLNGEIFDIDIRLKGKDTQSLKNDNLSYKIKVKGGSFLGMRSFSIHLPEEKGSTKEWAMHKILEEEGLLTPRYGFVEVAVNGSSPVLYAWEEHYEKQLVESKNRREGPIVRFNDESKLDAMQRGVENVNQFPFLDYATITPYREGKTNRDSILSMHYSQAVILMNQFRNGDLSDAVNVDQLAKICALTNLFTESTFLDWSTIRFYYDPILARLEPIGNDFFGADSLVDISTQQLIKRCFKDRDFKTSYESAVATYNSDDFINQTIASLDEKKGALPIDLDTSFLKKNDGVYEDTSQDLVAIKVLDTYEPIQGLGIAAIYDAPRKEADTRIPENRGVSLTNLHSKEIEILGSGNALGLLNAEVKSIVLAPKRKNKIKTFHGYVYYRVKDRDIVHKVKIQKHYAEKSKSTRQLFLASTSLPKGLTSKKDTLVMSGSVIIRKNSQIPAKKVLHILPGASITIENGAFLSFGTIIAQGTEGSPIVISSSNSAGFSVFNAPSRSKLTHVTFDGFNTLEEYGWSLTGAVNFYKSNVDIDHCSFINNTCEDALNIIDSEFTLTNSVIDNTFGDGFDGDFTTGVIEKCTFKNTGNDCLDFSGSEITISNTRIENSGDKGISGGENSHLTINDVMINKSKIAIASKDLSSIKIEGLTIDQCVYGFAVFQKKAEFGPASITSNNVVYTAIDTLQILDLNSKLNLNGTETIGGVKLDVAALYGL